MVAVLVAALASLGGAASAQARHTPAPVITGLRCVPAKTAACRHSVSLHIGRQVQVLGRGLAVGMRVTFRWSHGAIATKLHRSRVGWTARVPAGVRAGKISIALRDRAGRRSNLRHLFVVSLETDGGVPATLPGLLPAALRGDGMWIWQLPKTEGGDLDAIANRARLAGMSTLFIKSSDGANVWSQFTPQLVQALHARGLRVCAWQYVYGTHPDGEAAAGAAAVLDGADCLVIDAESSYEGRYASAQRFMTALRAAVGPAYPLGLTSFPYVDYHPQLPYSVFLGPGGAQANLPQVYWKAIGSTVDAVSAHTFAHNRIYGVPVAPLGQAYSAPSADEIAHFRALWAGYGAGGISWWSWQSASDLTFAALSAPAPAPLPSPDPGWPTLGKGAHGDEVVWLQEHLASADPTIGVSGKFNAAFDASLRAFQTARGLPVTGTTDPLTWQAALALPVHPVDWTAVTPAPPPPAAAAAPATDPPPVAAVARAHRAEIPQLGRGNP